MDGQVENQGPLWWVERRGWVGSNPCGTVEEEQAEEREADGAKLE